jgi:hypothetical protein
MKKFLMVCLTAAALLALEQQRASAWCNSHFSAGITWDYQSANNSCLWGLKRNYEPGAPMPPPLLSQCFSGCASGYGCGYPAAPSYAAGYPVTYPGHDGAPYLYSQPAGTPAQTFPPAPKTSDPAPKSSSLGEYSNGYQNAGYYYYSGYYYNNAQPVGFSDMGYGYGQAPSYWYGR